MEINQFYLVNVFGQDNIMLQFLNGNGLKDLKIKIC